jgi:hypothetical protein
MKMKIVEREIEYDTVIWRDSWSLYREGDIIDVEGVENTRRAEVVFVETSLVYGDNIPEHTLYLKYLE